MQFCSLVQAIAAGLTAENIRHYIDLIEKLITVAQVIETSVEKSQNPPQNVSDGSHG